MKEQAANSTFISQESGEEIVSSIGMTVLLISFSMLFATFFLGYAVFRLTAPAWPPAGVIKADLFIPSLSTAIMLGSSYFYYLFQRASVAASANQISKKKIYFSVTFLLAILFLYSQFSFWSALKTQGIFVGGGTYSSLLYALSWVHSAHIAGGILLLLFLIPQTFLQSEYILSVKKIPNSIKVINIGKFWHFLGIIWILIFVFLFIL